MIRFHRALWLGFALTIVLAFGAVIPSVALGQATGAANSAPRFVETQATGKGGTAEAAVRAALADALRRVNASTVGATDSLKRRFDDALADLDHTLAAPNITVAMMEADIRTASRGLVDRLKLLDERKSADGTSVDAMILTAVALFDGKTATRKAIAIAPFQVSAPNYDFAGNPVLGADIARKLADELTRDLVQANVLTVLDREHVETIAKEKSFVEMYGRTPDELARFGRMLGAEYLLIGSIENAGLQVTMQTVQASGYTFSRAFAGMQVNARLLEIESGAIVWADSVSSGLSNAALARMFDGNAPDATGTLAALVSDVGGELSGRVVEAVAPIKVALVEGDAVWLNRGMGRLAPGMRLQVRGGGRDVVDPDTGESLGSAEQTVAVIEVIVVDAKKSQCRIIEGKPEQVRPGQLARPLAMP